jgi:hypothetical protein
MLYRNIYFEEKKKKKHAKIGSGCLSMKIHVFLRHAKPTGGGNSYMGCASMTKLSKNSSRKSNPAMRPVLFDGKSSLLRIKPFPAN